MTGTVLVLNAGYEELHHVTLKHAITMLVREVVVVHEAVEGQMFGPYQMPRVLRLVRYVAMGWRQRYGPSCTKAGVRSRDGHKCGYCGGPADTADHILPASRGGSLSWLNTVAACKSCNNRKADRTPAEAGMRLLFRPSIPSGLPRTYVSGSLAVA